MERTLSPWITEAFNEITWTEPYSGRGTAGFGREYARQHYPSLKQPGTYWLEYYNESSGVIGKRVQSVLKSTQDAVTVDTLYNAIGNIKNQTIRANGGAAMRFEAKNNDWLLLNEGDDILARFQRGATAENFPLSDADLAFLGGPDDPHVYGKIFIKDKAIAEMIVPHNAITFARFKHQPLVPFMRNVPDALTKEQAEILLVFLLLPITH